MFTILLYGYMVEPKLNLLIGLLLPNLLFMSPDICFDIGHISST